MSFKLLILFTILLSLHDAHSSGIVKKITDDDFLKLTATNDYIIILFTRENCKPCEIMEYELLLAQSELQKTLHAVVAKIYDSKLVHVYDPSKEPALVFFRHGVPLLYLDEINDEVILHHFIENKDPTVKELNDENFEHLTQATTGSTTGDWYIMFYSKTCPISRELTASWEAIGAALRTKMNVARVSMDTPGFYTSRRLGITYTPSFVLLHRGNMYRYMSEDMDVDSLLDFARNFKQTRSIKIPIPASPMNFLLNSVTEFFDGNDWFLETGLLGILLGLIGAIFVKCMDRKVKREELQVEVEIEDDEDDDDEELETDPEHEKEN